MSYISKTYQSGNIFHAEDVNNIITGIDEIKAFIAEVHAEEPSNLLDVNKINHTLRYSPASGSIVDNGETKYGLFICKLKPNSTYILSYGVGGFGLYTEEPKKGSVALYKFETNHGATIIETKECQ